MYINMYTVIMAVFVHTYVFYVSQKTIPAVRVPADCLWNLSFVARVIWPSAAVNVCAQARCLVTPTLPLSNEMGVFVFAAEEHTCFRTFYARVPQGQPMPQFMLTCDNLYAWLLECLGHPQKFRWWEEHRFEKYGHAI